MMPNFLGLGAPRSGTTWLHNLLEAHPDAYVPSRRKEIKFFDREFERGLQWYQQFFLEASQHTAIGEITPSYLNSSLAPERIAATPNIDRFLVILRHPVHRLFSHYRWRQRHSGYAKDFSSYINDFPEDVQRSKYGAGLSRYLKHFKPEQFLILISEDAFADPGATCRQLGAFLDLDSNAFTIADSQPTNSAVPPRFGPVFRQVKRLDRMLRRHDLDKLANFFRDRLGVKSFFDKPRKWPASPTPKLDPTHAHELYEKLFAEDVRQVGNNFEQQPDTVWRRLTSMDTALDQDAV